MIRLSKSSLSRAEKDAVLAVLDSEFLGMGPEVCRFEEELSEFFGRPAVCVANGTAALHLALQATDVGAGDEVLVQSLTYVASFQAISASGAKPVACDVQYETLTLDWRDAEQRLTPRTKAVMPVHYAGGVGCLDHIYRFANQHNLRVIEDAAHAFGTTYGGRRIGSFGDVACFSFDGIKNITCGEGGCVVTDCEAVLDIVRDARLLAVKGDSEQRRVGARSWAPTIDRQGWRYHMSDVMAAIGRTQLTRFKEFKAKRRTLLVRYLSNLAGLRSVQPLQYEPASVIPHLLSVRLMPPANRTEVRSRLEQDGIQTGVHYFPAHRLAFYRDEHARPLKCTDIVADQLLSLPLHCDLSVDDVDFICGALERALR